MNRSFSRDMYSTLVAVIVLAISLTACGNTTASAPAGIGATATTAPNEAKCLQALPNGTAAPSLGAAFSDAALPASSVGTALAKVAGGGDGEFTISSISLCTPTSVTTNIQQYLNNELTANGWLHSNTFPSDGSFEAVCPANTYCFAKGIRYFELLSINSSQSMTVYSVEIGAPPPEPVCNSFFPGYYYIVKTYYYPRNSGTAVYFDVPLPPLTREEPDNATGSLQGFVLCSSGSVSMVTNFIDTHLTSLGWKETSISGPAQSWATPDGKLEVNFMFTSGQQWNIYWRSCYPNYSGC